MSNTNKEFFNFFNKLKYQQNNLEKNQINLINFIKNNFDLEIDRHFQKIEYERVQEFQKIQLETQNVYVPLKNVREMIKNVKNIDLGTLRDTLKRLKNNIENLKFDISTSLEILEKSENILSNEIDRYENYFQNEGPKNLKKIHQKSSILSLNCDKDMCPEVKEYVIFLNKTNGINGGWDSKDHAIFLKFYQKFNKNRQKILEILIKKFPDKSKNEILEHFNWYEKFVILKNRQKVAIKEWKKSKLENQINSQKEKLESAPKMGSKNSKTKTKIQNRKEVKEKILQWKVQRDLNKEHIEKILEIEKSSKTPVDFEKQKVLKENLKKWRENKKIQIENEKIQKEKNEMEKRKINSFLANRMIREFQKLDQIYLNNKKSLIFSKNGFDNPKFDKFEKSKKISRDPKRLLKPTAQWVNRIRPDENWDRKDPNFGVNFIANVPKLAVPGWRKLIS